MEGEIILLIGVGETREVASVEEGRKILLDKKMPSEMWSVNHLGILFTFVAPTPINVEDFEVRKWMLRAIHRWALHDL
jgi:hypothetical protein